MNDEFLHALRRDPPPEFARELQRRLRRQPARRGAWSSFVRMLLAMFLIGGVAMAAALLLRHRDEPRVDKPVAQRAAPSAPSRAAQPANAPSTDGQPAGNDEVSVPPQADASEAEDIPVTFGATSLTRPLVEVLVEQVTKNGRAYARARVTTMDESEAFRALCRDADFVMVSRRISDAEFTQCRNWGVEILEWQLGYQAVALAVGLAADSAPLTPRDVFLALARRIPDPAVPGRLIDNPNATWHDVDARLDYRSIDVLAPTDATTRAAFVQLVMEPGCDSYDWIRGLRSTDWSRYNAICHQLRSDERYREVELNIRLITQQLWSEPNWLVVLGYSYYAAHRTELLSKLEGPAPTLATLADGTYSAARPVYVYARRGHFEWSPGMQALAYELSNQNSFGPMGYLQRYGLVPLEGLPRGMLTRPSVPAPLESLKSR